MGYRGRFAPSPTGPLHFGSLVTALGSYLDARAAGGQWLLRIEDVDQSRAIPCAADRIQKTLETLGFEWAGEVVFQRQRREVYRDLLDQLKRAGRVFPCACSRSDIKAASGQRSTDGGMLYPGTCRHGLPENGKTRSWRLKVPDRTVCFFDRVQGEICQNLARDVGDFVLCHLDEQYTYQLAVVIDDALQGVNAVVRGVDLIDSTPRQIYLQHCFNWPTPSYAHLPVVLNAAGQKLSKQTRAPAVNPARGTSILVEALRFLGQDVPDDFCQARLDEFWRWAVDCWSIDRVPKTRGKPHVPCAVDGSGAAIPL